MIDIITALCWIVIVIMVMIHIGWFLPEGWHPYRERHATNKASYFTAFIGGLSVTIAALLFPFYLIVRLIFKKGGK